MSKPRYPARFFNRLKEFPARHCQNPECGKRLTPRIRPSGTLETPREFGERKTCSRACMGALRSATLRASLPQPIKDHLEHGGPLSGEGAARVTRARFPEPSRAASGVGFKASSKASVAADFLDGPCSPPRQPAVLTPDVVDRLGALGPRLEVACLEHPMLASFLAELALGEGTRGRRLAA